MRNQEIVCDHIETLEPIGHLLGGNSAKAKGHDRNRVVS
jgi:hypothetical protein